MIRSHHCSNPARVPVRRNKGMDESWTVLASIARDHVHPATNLGALRRSALAIAGGRAGSAIAGWCVVCIRSLSASTRFSGSSVRSASSDGASEGWRWSLLRRSRLKWQGYGKLAGLEYVPGRSIQDYMEATGPLDFAEALNIALKCSHALEYIHYHGVIHRDIKPGNIMYHPAQGIVKVMDFGVSHKIEEKPARDTGTIAYMAPEHFDRERQITALTDIFALGSSLYRLLTGQYPFDNRHTAFQIMHEDPEPMANLRADIPAELITITSRAMAKSDAERYQSAAEIAMDIENALQKLYPDSPYLNTSGRYTAL